MKKIKLGIEVLLDKKILSGQRIGLICNQSSVDHSYGHAADLLHRDPSVNLTTLYGPQHGIRGDVQDNMIETPHAVDRQTELPIYSLYSETREPTEEMLSNVDALIFDMQDVGCRIYTFIYTLANCMRAAARYGRRIYVCDRPNPIGGELVEGNVLESGQESFVGQFPLPTRHGMSVGELALMFKGHFRIECALEVIPMENWSRALWHDETDAPWVMPSPNMPTIATATVFPGTVHLEGTQMSEGRGTTKPFELIGAPYIDAQEYAQKLNAENLSGVFFRSTYFRPTFQKHAGQTCGGVQLHVTDRNRFEPVLAGVATIKAAMELYPQQFAWKNPPYEYEYERNPFDVIAGTTRLRESLERGESLSAISDGWRADVEDFQAMRREYLLYE